ncbi:hypothetical protein EDD18DRAFT_1462410 [Armillaria luteobubalina]|uniref:Uncharacterized protein n=1 Tax=Armillaria luteobubalina TaxID=153913 RepID=A0AA39Q7N9_9AGAR|nr:hypothetical protein EDD18DRAFT_1462410 [Armillaria luteobubalina]
MYVANAQSAQIVSICAYAIQVRHQVPPAYIFIHGGGNVVFHGLSCLWFGKTIEAMRMRFFGDSEVKAHTTIGMTPKQNGHLQHRRRF